MYGIEGLLAGRTLGGRYRVDAVVGRGGMGAVYRATDERLGRAVAVKVISVAAAEPHEHERLRARFHREARAAAGLHHPNVVAVHDYGTDPELGLDYLVMELLHGEDLAARLGRAGAPPRQMALSILRQSARGLAAGHRAGLVHRDVKPGNLFLAASDHPAEPHVRVLDFGIAQVTAEEGGTMAQLTEFGRSPLSPAYASPEQLRGDDVLTPASDVFSLGAVGYHLLTGYRCFGSSDPQRMAEELGQATRALDDRAPGLDPSVRAALLRALAPRPTERFPNAGALADALAADLAAPTIIPTDGAPGRARFAPPASRPAAHDDGGTRLMDDHTLFAAPAPRPESRRAPMSDATEFFPAAPPRAPQPVARPRAEGVPERPAPLPQRPAAAAPPAQAPSPFTVQPPQAAHPASERGMPAPPPPQGRVRRFLGALWSFTLTVGVMALFAGAWTAAVTGVLEGDRPRLMLGAAATVLLTPLAVHRLTGCRGRFGWVLFGSVAATAGAVYLGRRSEAETTVMLAGMFGLQVFASWIFTRLTRKKRPQDRFEA